MQKIFDDKQRDLEQLTERKKKIIPPKDIDIDEIIRKIELIEKKNKN